MSLKKLAAIALAMTMSLSMLVACGDDDSSTATNDSSAAVTDASSEDASSEESSEEESSEDESSEEESSEDESSEAEEPGEVTMDEEPVAAEGDIQAFLMIADGGWSWGEGNWNLVSEGSGLGTDASITGDGTYTVSVNSTQLGAETKGFGYMVFCVDIPGLASTLGCATGNAAEEGTAGAEAEDTAAKVAAAKETGLSITGVSILQNGEKVYTYNDEDVIFADIEGNGNIRIEIWNEYGDTKGAGLAPAEVEELAGGVDEYDIIAVEFTIDLPDAE